MSVHPRRLPTRRPACVSTWWLPGTETPMTAGMLRADAMREAAAKQYPFMLEFYAHTMRIEGTQ